MMYHSERKVIKNLNKKFVKHKILILAFISIIFLLTATGALAQYDYTPMEKIPGTTEDISTFPNYIKAIYKFAIWSVGIAALLMVSVGGFMYFSAAGNTSKLEKAKIVIRDSIFGITAVLAAYLLLYTINPDLVGVSLSGLSNLGHTANASVSFQQASPSQGTANSNFTAHIGIIGNGTYTLNSLTISGMDSSSYTSSLNNNTITVTVPNPSLGNHQITAVIQDQDNNSHTSENINFKIISDLSQLAITTLGLNEGIAEENYSNQAIAAEGGTKPYAITAQNLPPGLTFDSSSNTITGTPIQAGSYLVLISATDSASHSAEKTLTLNIREGTHAGNNGNDNQSNSAELSRNPLSLSVTEGGNISNKTIMVTDNLGNSLAFQIVGINGDWISSPKAGDTGHKTLNVGFDTTSLSAGNHNGSVTLKPDGFGNLTLNILLTVWESGEEGRSGLPECQCGVNILPGYLDYCQICGPCRNNQGYCNSNSECARGLICNKYNICAHSDYGTPGDCSYNFPNGHPQHCFACGPCSNSQGQCTNNRQCKSGYCDLKSFTCQAGPREECSVGGNLPECQCGVDLFPGYDNYCSLCGPCEHNEGPCYYDSQCKGDLVCHQRHGYNFCTTPEIAADNPNWTCPFPLGHHSYCAVCKCVPRSNCSESLCLEGEGFCHDSRRCMGNLVCDEDTHVCVRTKGPGITCRE